jgi:hypothetical protein
LDPSYVIMKEYLYLDCYLLYYLVYKLEYCLVWVLARASRGRPLL